MLKHTTFSIALTCEFWSSYLTDKILLCLIGYVDFQAVRICSLPFNFPAKPSRNIKIFTFLKSVVYKEAAWKHCLSHRIHSEIFVGTLVFIFPTANVGMQRNVNQWKQCFTKSAAKILIECTIADLARNANIYDEQKSCGIDKYECNFYFKILEMSKPNFWNFN